MTELKHLTEFDLIELKQAIEKELEEYDNRAKILVYAVYLEYEGLSYFTKIENAEDKVRRNVDIAFSDGMKCYMRYLTEAQVKEYCNDYSSDGPQT
jgi:hypothetical protein